MSDRSRILATYCIEPRHGHDTLEAGRVLRADCAPCVEETAAQTPGMTRIIKVELSHMKGKGHRLYVTPMTRERRASLGTSESHMLFDPVNIRRALDSEARFSAKKLADYALDPELLALLVEQVRRAEIVRAAAGQAVEA